MNICQTYEYENHLNFWVIIYFFHSEILCILDLLCFCIVFRFCMLIADGLFFYLSVMCDYIFISD